MRKTASFAQSQDHVKPFVVAIGIAFTFLALVVIYIAFTKGGMDIRSRAGQLISERCYKASIKAYANGKPVYACLSGGTLRGSQCCIQMMQKTNKVMATPTSKPTLKPTPTKKLIRVQQQVLATPTPKR